MVYNLTQQVLVTKATDGEADVFEVRVSRNIAIVVIQITAPGTVGI